MLWLALGLTLAAGLLTGFLWAFLEDAACGRSGGWSDWAAVPRTLPPASSMQFRDLYRQSGGRV